LPQGGLRRLRSRISQRFDLAAARGNHGEFRANEEGVPDQQENQPEDSGPVTHAAPPAAPAAWFLRRTASPARLPRGMAAWLTVASSAPRVGRKQMRSMRRPSMRVT